MKKIISILVLALLLLHVNVYSQCNPQFTWTSAPTATNLLRVSLTNTTTYPTPSMSFMPSFHINFGDNSTGYIYSTTTHDYATPGIYTVTLYMTALDSINQLIICSDSVTQQVTVSYPPCASTITTLNNGNGSYTFTAVNPANTPNLTYSWNFGDGNTGTGSSVTHVYNTSGNFTVSLQVTGIGCTSTAQTSVTYFNNTSNCDSLHAGFASAISGLTLNLTNTSNMPSSLYPSVTREPFWIFGDGYTSNSFSGLHTYANGGTYTVMLVNSWVDSMTQNVLCVDSFSQQITLTTPPPPNYIAGTIHWDPTTTTDSVYNFKVWLITHDTSANTLTAVDSVNVYPWVNGYTFNNVPNGEYLVKAAPYYATWPLPAYGYVPTYHDSSLYWSGASTIVHTGGTTTGKDIWMQFGTPTTGPGFVGGNISMGAGKGTGTGVPDMLVFLRNNTNNKMIASTYTDANGDYSFSNIAGGSYNVYPEEMNYTTTPSTALDIITGQTSSTGVDFVQTDDEIKPATELGIPSVSKNDGISIYPNPVSDQLFIENKTGSFNQFSIVNTIGQVVKQESLKQGNNKVETLTLGSGIYYIIVNGVDGSRSMKITKK